MLKFIPFEGFDFTKSNSYHDFVSENILDSKCNILNLGASSGLDMDIYALSYGNLLNKPVIYIEGSIHGGHEWRCGHYISRFMEAIANPDNYPAQSRILKRIRAKYSFVAIPCLNAFGYENNTYYNGNGVNLNWNFDYNWEANDPSNAPESAPNGKGEFPFSEPETKIVKKIIETYKPIMTLSYHTWGDDGMAYRPHPAGPDRLEKYQLFLSSIQSMKLFGYPLHQGYPANGTVPRESSWAATLKSKNGRNTFTAMPEVGGGFSPTEQSEIGLNSIISFVLHAEKWNEQKILNPHGIG